MTTALQPGITAPEFSQPAAGLEAPISMTGYPGQKIVLLFFPASASEPLVASLAKYQAKAADFEAQGAILIGLSNAASDQLTRLATTAGLQFPLLSDPDSAGAVAGKYGIATEDQQPLPTVFIIDEDRLIRRVYEAAKYPNLPNPAMVLRAIKKLAGVPKATPVTPDDWQLGPADAPRHRHRIRRLPVQPLRRGVSPAQANPPGVRRPGAVGAPSSAASPLSPPGPTGRRGRRSRRGAGQILGNARPAV